MHRDLPNNNNTAANRALVRDFAISRVPSVRFALSLLWWDARFLKFPRCISDVHNSSALMSNRACHTIRRQRFPMGVAGQGEIRGVSAPAAWCGALGNLVRTLECTVARFDLISSLKLCPLEKTTLCMRRTVNFSITHERSTCAGLKMGHFTWGNGLSLPRAPSVVPWAPREVP